MRIDGNQDVSKISVNSSFPLQTKEKIQEDTSSSIQDRASIGSPGDEKLFPDKIIAAGKKAAARQITGELGAILKEAQETGDYGKIIKMLEGVVGEIMADPEAEAQMIEMIAGLNATGQLKPALYALADSAKEAGVMPPMSDEQKTEYIEMMAGVIDSELRNKGMTPDSAGKVYQSWEKMGQEHVQLVRNSMIPPRGPGEMSAFTEPGFLKEMETLQGAPFVPGNSITPLINGPVSFSEKDRLLDSAKESIHFMTWAIYDDETGWGTVEKLAQKHKEGVDVKVVVDGQVGSKSKHQKPLSFLDEQGIPVVRWRNPDEPYHGQHRKFMIVDGKAVIAGGTNPGNVYSHRGENEGKWKDVDILIKGPAVADCERLFAKVSGMDTEPKVSEPEGRARTAVVNHTPGEDSHIMLANMKAIQGASESIDIENAYFIQTPGMKQVMMDALERGVKIRLLTNSGESVDEKVVSTPILKSLPELVEAGAEIYLKQGDTLHSKYMVVDGIYSTIGSYNLHPRSERYEGEVMFNTLDPETAGNLTKSFESEIAMAKRVEKADDIQIQENILSVIASRYFFDQL